jgi:DNA-directed RNA polymerase specialized sigma24 family protein
MEHTCEACVDSYMQRYGWELVTREALLSAVEREYIARPERGAGAARAALLWSYSAILYRACSGAEGGRRQEQGYSELYRFLARAAARRYTRVAAEATQHAVERVYLSFERCRQPETFLAFVLQKLRDAARAELRLVAQSAEQLPVDAADTAEVSQSARRGDLADPADSFVHTDLRQRMARAAAGFVEQHPRAAQQFAALWLKYIDGLDDKTIALRLGRTPAAVQVLRSRALRRLRAEPGWQLLASELGMAAGA